MYTIGWTDANGTLRTTVERYTVDAAMEIETIERSQYQMGIGVQCDTVSEMVQLIEACGDRIPFMIEHTKPSFAWLGATNPEFGFTELHMTAPFVANIPLTKED
jgi:hypothetical protein